MVYFIWDSGSQAVKIGYTAEIDVRLRELQTGNPNPLFLLGTVTGDRDRERAIHAKFADHRIAGEWFRVSPKLMWFVRKATQGVSRVESDKRSIRECSVVEWLMDRFRERREWESHAIWAAAQGAGFSRRSLHCEEVQRLPIRKRPRSNERGESVWYWIAEEGWPS